MHATMHATRRPSLASSLKTINIPAHVGIPSQCCSHEVFFFTCTVSPELGFYTYRSSGTLQSSTFSGCIGDELLKAFYLMKVIFSPGMKGFSTLRY